MSQWIILLFAANVFGESLWIKAPQTAFLPFKAHVEALGSQHKSFAEHQLKELREKAKNFYLINQLEKAQELYLDGQTQEANTLFKKITQTAFQADWEEEERRILLYSFLRQAQNETHSNKKKALLLSASRFYGKPLDSQYPDFGLFPPPLIESFNQVQKQSTVFSLNWQAIFPQHEIFLINGERKKESSLNLSEGFYRITSLSSSHEPWSQYISISQLLSKKIKTSPLTEGLCENLKIKALWQTKDSKLFSLKKCPSLFIKKELQQKKNLLKDPGFMQQKTGALEKQAIPSSFQQLKKQKWFLIGGGLLVLSLYLYMDGQKTEGNQVLGPYH